MYLYCISRCCVVVKFWTILIITILVCLKLLGKNPIKWLPSMQAWMYSRIFPVWAVPLNSLIPSTVLKPRWEDFLFPNVLTEDEWSSESHCFYSLCWWLATFLLSIPNQSNNCWASKGMRRTVTSMHTEQIDCAWERLRGNLWSVSHSNPGYV